MTPKSLITALLATCATSTLMAQTLDVRDAWVRATIQGQTSSGAYMRLSAKAGGTLVGVTTPVAAAAEIHQMKVDQGVMTMRPLPKGLDLPPNQVVALAPGGYHIMLTGLKLPLQKNTTIPMTLVLRDAKGVESRMDLQVPVALSAPGGEAAGGHKH